MTNSRMSKGMDIFRQLDPELAENILTAFDNTSPDLAKFAIEFGYGDIMSRQEIDLKTRELLNIAMLGAMGHAPLQLAGHIKGALAVGASKTEIAEVAIQIAVYAGFPSAFNTLISLEKILESTKT